MTDKHKTGGQDYLFRIACKFAGVEPSGQQRRKWALGIGAAADVKGLAWTELSARRKRRNANRKMYAEMRHA